MKLTADTITDEQIRELRRSYSVPRVNALLGTTEDEARDVIRTCGTALSRPEPTAIGRGNSDISTWRKARARCAEILNAREREDDHSGS